VSAILDDWNAHSDAERKAIDPVYFHRLPASTHQERRRSCHQISDGVRKSRSLPFPIPTIAGQGIKLVSDLFIAWDDTEGTSTYHRPSAIRDRWNSLPSKIRLAIAGHNPKVSAKIPPGNVGRLRIRKRRSVRLGVIESDKPTRRIRGKTADEKALE
jgi:hypothetical protein